MIFGQERATFDALALLRPRLMLPIHDRYNATLILDARHWILDCDAAARVLLARANLFSGAVGEPVRWRSADLQTKVPELLRTSRLDTHFVVGHDSTGVPHVLVLRKPPVDPEHGGATAQVVVRDIVSWAEEETRFPSRVFRLTASEGALAQSIVMGRNLDAHAAMRGSTVATARKQLSAVFAKTGTNRQIELAATLLATAAARTVLAPVGIA